MDGRPVISLSSNNYLGLATHPHLVEAALAAVRDLGVGSGAVRTIAGTMELHEELERRLAAFKHTEADAVFQSGFTANSGVIPTITTEQDLIVSDELNHASIIDGVRLSKASRAVYPHKDVDGLEAVLRDARAKGGRRSRGAYRRILVITDGVFSMDGDIAPLPGICDVAERYDAAVMVDDAHASGVLGRNGRGTIDHFDLHGRVDIQVGHALQGGRRARRLRGRPPAPARLPRPAGAARSSSPPPIRPRCRLPASPRSTSSRASRSASSGCGRTRASSRRAWPAWASTPASARRRSRPSSSGELRRARQISGRLLELGVFATSVVYPDGRHRPGPDPHDRQRPSTRRDDLQACLDAFATAGRELRLIGG